VNDQIVDVLAFGAHPDDIELGCGGTLLSLSAQGYKVGMVDMTRGDRGSRGTVEDRDREANDALKVLGFEFRENLNLGDQRLRDTIENRVAVVECIRRHKPRIVFTHWIQDRHPDHEGAGVLVKHAMFLSGASNFEGKGEAHVPSRLLFWSYTQLEPNIYVDISSFYEKKIEATKCHRSQFHDPNSSGPKTLISSPQFFDNVQARHRYAGLQIGTLYAETFFSYGKFRIDDPVDFFAGE
jgi:bacillithiol biosynthesis deacetylase BshB1